MAKPLEALINRAKHIVENGGLLAKDSVLSLVDYIESAGLKIEQLISDRQMAIAEISTLKQRIAELEASQLAVKLPSRLQPGADGPDDWYLHSDPDGEYMKADDVIEAIRAAGITVQEDES